MLCLRHDQVLEDHVGSQRPRDRDHESRIGDEVEEDVVLILEHPADALRDDALIVDEQDADLGGVHG